MARLCGFVCLVGLSRALVPPEVLQARCFSAAGEAARVTLLPSQALSGKHKWLGGAKWHNGEIYGIPGHARSVLRLDPARGTVDALAADALPHRRFKWLRGVVAEEAIYGLPVHATSVLKISPSRGTVEQIGELPEEERHLEWKWHGGALAPDGIIYGIPANARSVLKVNSTSDEVATLGKLPATKSKWYGGILGVDGCVYGVPYAADGVLRVDPATQLVDGRYGSDVLKHVGTAGYKYHGGILGPDGCIYCFPAHADRVLKIDTNPGGAGVSLIGPSLSGGGVNNGRYKWGGGAIGIDGCVYGMPSDCNQVLRIRCGLDEVSTIELPQKSAQKNKWQNGVLASDGAIYAIPADAQSVLRIQCGSGELSYVGSGLHGDNKWQGGVLGDDGAIYGTGSRSARADADKRARPPRRP